MSKAADNVTHKTTRATKRVTRRTAAPLQGMPPDEMAGMMRKQLTFWIGAVIIFVLFLLMFSSILLPFVAGMALAYFLDPVAGWLERFGMSRIMATILILMLFLVLLIMALMVIVPVLASQLSDFISRFPLYVTQLQSLVANEDSVWLQNYLGIDSSVIKANLSTLLKQGAGFLSTLLQSLWNSGKSLIDIAGLFVVTPVVAFYMLLDWHRMIDSIDSWVPRNHVETVRSIAREMNDAVAGFIRGQGTLCLILGSYYAVGLTLTGLNFGLLIGLFAGFISFIPYVGSFVGLALAIGVALVQFWPDYVMVIAVACVFFVGQFIEGNILQPKLVGSSVGLHPVWLMFALFAFGSLFGFTGMLVAVPAAAAVGVLVRFALNSYLHSPLYDASFIEHHGNVRKDETTGN
jgi:predicted PurR-regulated permease PerM